MSDSHTKNWPDLAIGLYDRLTGSNAEINYDFDDLTIQVPSGTGKDAEHAQWVLSGKLTISTQEKGSADSPKVAMAGTVVAKCSGQEVLLEFSGRDILIRCPKLRTLLLFKRGTPIDYRLISEFLNSLQLRVLVGVGERNPIEALPQPHWLFRLLNSKMATK